MNNLKYYNDSLAYDFEMFSPKDNTQSKPDNIVVMPKNRRSAAKRLSPTFTAIMCIVFVLAGLCGSIALRIKINEVNSEINDVKAAVAELDGEKTELEVEFQRRISYVNLELEALSLGMKKPNKEEVKYIRVNNKDVAKDASGKVLQ